MTWWWNWSERSGDHERCSVDACPDTGSSGGGDMTRGQWKTSNQTIYINEGYGWQPYATYVTDGGSLLMKFGDGSKQLWKRSN